MKIRKFKVRITLPGETRGFQSDTFGTSEADCLEKLRERWPGATITIVKRYQPLGAFSECGKHTPTLEERREIDTAPESLRITRARLAYTESLEQGLTS